MSSQESMNSKLENWIDGRTWEGCIKQYSGEEVHPDWQELVDLCGDIALYPNEQKELINFMHELLNWVACCDSGFENPPEYQEGERNGEPVSDHAVSTMKWYFEKKLTKQAIDGLRSICPWIF